MISKNFLLNVLWNLLIFLEEHRVVTTTLSSGTQVCGVTEHLRQRNICLNHLTTADIFHTFDTATTGVDITDYITHVFFWHGNFNLHDRLKKNWVTLCHSILECHRSGNVECHFRRVDFMVRTIVYISAYTQYWESAKDTGLRSLFNTFANCWDIFLRNSTTNNGRSELEGFFCVWIHWCEVNFTMSVLSTTTGLLSILAVYINSLSKCFLISNLRSTYVSLYVEFTQQTVYDDVQMQLTHTGDNGLTSLFVGTNTESRIFFCQLYKSVAHLILACFCLRLDSDIDNWLWEFHRLQDYWMLFITDGITSCGILETNGCSNITGVYTIKFVSLVCMHLKDTSYTLLLILCSIQYIRTGC